MDNGDVTKRSKVAEGQKYQRGQEYAPDEEDEQQYEALAQRDTHTALTDLEKGKSKGKGKDKGKGKPGKGKGSKATVLALTNGHEEDPAEEEESKENFAKCCPGLAWTWSRP